MRVLPFQACNLPPALRSAGMLLLLLALHLSAGGATVSPTNIATLEFRSADRIWDVAHRVAILCDPAGHRVVSLGPDGRIQAVWQATESQFPEALALSPDGRRIAVTLPVRPHSDFWFDSQTGGIAVLDAETLTAERTLTLDLDPWDVALLDDGHLLVSGGSGQFTTVNLYPPDSSTPVGSQGARQRSYLMPSRDGRRVYLADTDIGPASLRQLDLNPASPASPLSDPGRSYLGSISARSRPLARPDGALVILNGGHAVGVSASSETGLVRLGGLLTEPLSFTGVVWDAARGMLLVCTEFPEPALMAFHSGSLLPVSVSTTDRAVDALFVDGDALYGTVRESERTIWVQLPHPALGAETNRTPAASFTEIPQSIRGCPCFVPLRIQHRRPGIVRTCLCLGFRRGRRGGCPVRLRRGNRAFVSRTGNPSGHPLRARFLGGDQLGDARGFGGADDQPPPGCGLLLAAGDGGNGGAGDLRRLRIFG